MTDLIIIGAGPGGYETAVRAAKLGLQVTIVESKHLGGTCLNEGCIPTKCLCHSAEMLDEIRGASSLGINAENITFNLEVAIERKNQVVAQLTSGVAGLMKSPGITLVNGKASFKDKNTVCVTKPDGSVEELSAKHIIIATGSVSKFLPIEGAHSENVVTSTELLDMTSLPKRLCVIGGGVIGLEFASIFNSFGSEVTVVEFCKEVLPNLDKDIAKRLRTSLKKRGISFHVDAAVTAVKTLEDGSSEVCFTEKGKEASVNADCVLMAVGRAANLESLNLDEVGISYTRRGIDVNADMQTNIPEIYAIGDINGICPLAHAATFQGYRAIDHILGNESEINLEIIPSAVFTVPELASVGRSEEQLKDADIDYKSHKYFYRANGKALSLGADEGLVKILADENGKVLGAHILGAHASDLIHEVTLLMSKGGTLEDIAKTVHAHPTLSELVLAAAES